MTIATEITRIKTNISNTYAEAKKKGVQLPAEQNSDNLAACIKKIPQGGGGGEEVVPEGSYKVTFYDYDGTVLSKKIQKKGEEIIYPEHPVHENITFKYWNLDPSITTVQNHLDIGALYDSNEADTDYFTLDINSNTGMDLYFSLVFKCLSYKKEDGKNYFNNTQNKVVYEIDYGDGTIDKNFYYGTIKDVLDESPYYFSSSSISEFKPFQHKYTQEGTYTLKIKAYIDSDTSTSERPKWKGSSIYFGKHSGKYKRTPHDFAPSVQSNYTGIFQDALDDFRPLSPCHQVTSALVNMDTRPGDPIKGDLRSCLKTIALTYNKGKSTLSYMYTSDSPRLYDEGIFASGLPKVELFVVPRYYESFDGCMNVKTLVAPTLWLLQGYFPNLDHLYTCSTCSVIQNSIKGQFDSLKDVFIYSAVTETKDLSLILKGVPRLKWNKVLGSFKEVIYDTDPLNGFLGSNIEFTSSNTSFRYRGYKEVEKPTDASISFDSNTIYPKIPKIEKFPGRTSITFPRTSETSASEVFVTHSLFESIDLSKTGITEITPNNAFNGNRFVSSYVFPKELKRLNYYFTFSNNEILREIHLDGINHSNTNSTSMFEGCKSLRLVTFENVDFSSITTSDNMFKYCHSLIDFPIMKNLKVFGYYFAAETAIQDERNLHFDQMAIETIGSNCFSGCNNLQTFAFPNTVKKISAQVFSYCRKLKKVWIPKEVITVDSTLLGYGSGSMQESFQFFTDAPSKPSGWNEGFNKCSSTPFPVNYGSTYEQYLQA